MGSTLPRSRDGCDAARVSEPTIPDDDLASFIMGELDAPTVVDFPLRGEWTVERTPAERIPSHGTDAFGLRYAYDLIRTDERPGLHVHPAGTLRWLLIGGRTRDCFGWGQPVHAAFAGEVLEAVDGVSERRWLHPVTETWAGLRNVFPSRDVARTRFAGNYVIIGSASTYALYAHLAIGPLGAFSSALRVI